MLKAVVVFLPVLVGQIAPLAVDMAVVARKVRAGVTFWKLGRKKASIDQQRAR